MDNLLIQKENEVFSILNFGIEDLSALEKKVSGNGRFLPGSFVTIPA